MIPAYLRMLAMQLRGLVTRPEARLDEEIEEHLAMLAAELERRGMAPGAARTEARRQFGGVTQTRERCREQSRLAFADSLGMDLAYALRQWTKSPLFAATAVITLAIGIGANTAIFRVLDAVALRPLPATHPDQLVLLQPLDHGRPNGSFSFPRFRELAAHPELFSGVMAMGDDFTDHAAVAGRGPVKLEHARLVTGNYFRLLGVDCALGRALLEDDDRPGAPGVAVVSYQFWRGQLGGATDILGRTLEIGTAHATIIGVAPKRFSGERVLFAPDAWLPMSMQPRLMTTDWTNGAGLNFLDVMARLRPGVSIRRAQAVLGPHYRRLMTQDGDDNGAFTLHVVPGGHGIVISDVQTSVERPLWVLQGALALLLLIACCNLANLLLARAAARTHEMGVRMALGAGRTRLVRQLLTESLLLTALGAAAGILLVAWCGPPLMEWADLGELQIDTSFNWQMFAFNAAVCAAAAALFGLAPALAGSRLDVRSALQANRRSYTGLPRQSVGKALVVAQMAICLTVLCGAALLGRSLWNMLHQEFGFRQEGLLLADMKMDWATAFSEESAKRFATISPLVLEKLNALPGVRSAALSFGGPLTNGGSTSLFSVAGRQPRPEDHGSQVAVSPAYFETMGIPLLAGRGILASDTDKGPRVAVLAETAARVLFGSTNPVGRFVSLSAHFEAKDALQVVGVVRDVRLSASNEKAGMEIFVPLAQQPLYFSSIALRTNAKAGALAPAVRKALAEVDGNLTMTSIRPVSEILDDLTSTGQTLAQLIAIFGGLALLLASTGIYGVLAYEVQRRTPEISIRMALGATRGQVMGLMLGQLGRWLALGILIGLGAAICASAAMRSLLFGITAWDSSLLAAAVLLLSLVAAAAALLPARRAARLNLLDGLRQE